MVRCSRLDWNYLARTRAAEYKYCVHYIKVLRRPYRRSCAKTIGQANYAPPPLRLKPIQLPKQALDLKRLQFGQGEFILYAL
jgi:hypothetical protein